ncbi:MAG: HIT family protein [Planctomycetota bacterium]
MRESIFTKIVAGEIPCHRVYEDDRVLAFLDIGPVSRGHTLVIPKDCYVELDEMPAEVAGALGAVLPRLVAAVREATGCDGVNVLQNNGAAAGQAVMHVHFHLIPRYGQTKHDSTDGVGGRGFCFEWPAGKLPDADAKLLQQSIGEALKKQS